MDFILWRFINIQLKSITNQVTQMIKLLSTFTFEEKSFFKLNITTNLSNFNGKCYERGFNRSSLEKLQILHPKKDLNTKSDFILKIYYFERQNYLLEVDELNMKGYFQKN